MASIGGLSESTSSSINGIRGYGGMASGLDRDSLIEGMTYGTTQKIEKWQGKKTKLEWEQDSIRNITDKMIGFGDKYTSTMTSPSNLYSDALWGKSIINAKGANSKYVSVSGTGNSNISIAGIKQLAEKARLTSKNTVSDGMCATGAIDVNKEYGVELLVGKTLDFDVNGTTHSITLTAADEDGNAYKWGTVDDIANSLNDILKKDDKLNAYQIKVEVSTDKKLTIQVNDHDKILKLKGGTAADALGFKNLGTDGTEIKKNQELTSSEEIKNTDLIDEHVSFIDKVAGKELTFSYNGDIKDFTLPTKDELEQAKGKELETIKDSLQNQFNKAYGTGRVEVKLEDEKLTFSTKNPKDNSADNSSTLTLVSGDSNLVGENGALNVKSGESNRVNLNAKISEAGFKGLNTIQEGAAFKINGTEITIGKDDTVFDLMDKINENTNVNIEYQASADKFIITSKEDGASGKIQIEDSKNGGLEVFKKIFGENATTTVQGKDAVVAIKYGESGEVVEQIRGTNSFTIDGMTIGLKGTFGYLRNDDGNLIDKDGNVIDEDGNVIIDVSNTIENSNTGISVELKLKQGVPVLDTTAEAITFDAKVDTDKIVDTVKDMITEYNEILELVNKELTTKPDRSYQPLTAAQKKELSKEEIELYEEKAKEGLLFGDSDLRALSSELRFVISPLDLQKMEKIGITVSTTYSDNGKLNFDETKFRAALESDPENVQELFTKKREVDENGNVIQDEGIAGKLKSVMTKYANNIGSYGILVTRAGTSKAPRSITDNAIYKELQEINKKIEQFQRQLKIEQDRYIKQFTSLETVISQMNSQSSYLSQLSGSY